MPVRQKISPKRVLVVDDDPQVADTVQMLLMIRGHKAEVAHSGEKALELFQAKQPELVVTDFSLPGMDGLELAQALRKIAPQIPIVLITAYGEVVRERTGPVSNIDVLVPKPFSGDQLEAALAEVFPAG